MSTSMEPEVSSNGLLHRYKIVSVNNGYVDLMLDNLKKILNNSSDILQISGHIPIAFLAVIGPKGSGKSLFTNFIMEYLRSGCCESWWTKVKNQNDKWEPIGPGFSWGSVSHAGLFQPEGPLASTSGIYLWPEPFFLEKSGEKKVLVWVLHMHVVENKQDDMRELEKFLMVVCSRVMEIQLAGDIDTSFRVLDHFRNILTTQEPSDPNSFTPEEICSSIVYVIRSFKKSITATNMTEEDSKAELLALAERSSKTPVDKALLDHFQHVNVTWMKESRKALHDDNGIFFPQVMKAYRKTFESIVTTMVENSKILEKKTPSEQSVTLEGMLNFLVTTANRLSTGKNISNQDKLEPTDSVYNDRDIHSSPDSLVTLPSLVSGSSSSTPEDVVNHTYALIGRIPSQESMHVDSMEVEEAAEQMQIAVLNIENNQEEIQQPDVAELERQRREREEEEEARLRQQKANARLAMELCVPIALTQLRETFLMNVGTWIVEQLDLSTVNQCPPIYSLALDVVLQNYRCQIDKSLHQEFKAQLDAKYEAKYLRFLVDISEFITKLNDRLENFFRQFVYFSHEEFKRMAETLLAEVHTDKKVPFFTMATHATNRLLTLYEVHNDLITDLEAELYTQVTCTTAAFYQEEMERCMRKHVPCRTSKLQIIHGKLKGALLDVVINACRRPHCDPEKMIETELRLMKVTLDFKFLEHKERNSKTLKNMLAIATKIISSAKMEYNKGMEKLLDEYPKGIERTAFQVHHEIMKRQVITMLEGKMRSDVRKEEPLEDHRKELESYITNYWPAVEAENEKRLEGGQRNEGNPQKGEQEENVEPCASSSAVCLQSPKTRERESTQIPLETIATVKELPPIIFYLKQTRILMAIDAGGEPQILRNEMGEQETPACLAVHPRTNEFIYGTEALTLVNASNDDDGSSDSVDADSFWCIAERLLNGNVTWFKTVTIGEISHHITLEFLLAFLLKKLKLAVEARMNETFSRAIVVVPFWLTSLQRIQFKDAASLAGFSASYLINEPSAAAYSLLLGSTSPRSEQEGKVLVVIENKGCVTAVCYRYSRDFTRKLIMLEHEVHYLSDAGTNEALPKKALTKTKITSVWQAFGIGWVTDLLWGEQQPQSGQEMKLFKVREVCSKVIKKAKPERSDIFECLIICGDENRCQDIFQLVAKEFSNAPDRIREDLAVLQGAVALSGNPEEIGRYIRDKSAFDLERICEPEHHKIDVKNKLLPEGTQIVKITLPRGESEVALCQQGLRASNEVGTLTVKGFQGNFTLEPNLSISNEAIISFSHAMQIPDYRTITKERVDQARVRWTTQKLPSEVLEKLKDSLTLLITPSERNLASSIDGTKASKQVNEDKANLLQKCEEMIESINGGKIVISSAFVKNQALKQLQTAKSIAMQTDPSAELVEVTMNNVEKIRQMYSTQDK